jgi:hypothetical protein
MPVSPHPIPEPPNGGPLAVKPRRKFHHPIHVSKSAIAALTLPLAPSAIAGVWVKAEKLKS